MRSCTNDDLGEGVDLFPEDLQDGVAIIAYVHRDLDAWANDEADGFFLHLHQGSDCVTLPCMLWTPLSTWLEGAASRLVHVRELDEANR